MDMDMEHLFAEDFMAFTAMPSTSDVFVRVYPPVPKSLIQTTYPQALHVCHICRP